MAAGPQAPAAGAVLEGPQEDQEFPTLCPRPARAAPGRLEPGHLSFYLGSRRLWGEHRNAYAAFRAVSFILGNI